MKIDFNEIQEIANPQFKGGVGDTMFRTYNDGQNKIMRGRLDPGCSIGLHSHETNSEIIYILSGEARCLYDDGEERLVPDHSHSLINASATEPLTFFAIVPEQISI